MNWPNDHRNDQIGRRRNGPFDQLKMKPNRVARLEKEYGCWWLLVMTGCAGNCMVE